MLTMFFLSIPTAAPEIYTLSLHDALPICDRDARAHAHPSAVVEHLDRAEMAPHIGQHRSEEHTSELQSRGQIVCRLLLDKKKTESSNRRDANTMIHPQLTERIKRKEY